LKTEAEIRENYSKVLKSYQDNVASGFCNHGAVGEVTGICSRQYGNIEAFEWMLEIKENEDKGTG
jgi:hypothetical protein